MRSSTRAECRFASAVVSLWLAPIAAAATIHVPGDYATIHEAVGAAIDGDEIVVGPGTYLALVPIEIPDKSITLRSSEGPAVTIIDGGGSSRVVECTSGAARTTVLQGFTITGGSASDGAGMFIEASSPSVIGCRFVNNTVTGDGGAIFAWLEANPLIVDCEFAGNTAGDKGGGVWTGQLGSANVIGCVFDGNFAQGSGGLGGGGYYCGDSVGQVLISNCRFSGNSSATSGGAISFVPGTYVLITSSDFCANAPNTIDAPYLDGGGNAFLISCPGDGCESDLTQNGIVDFADLVQLLSDWGPCPE